MTDIAIVLTGTIIPNASFTVHSDWKIRRREYLAAIDYYSQYAPVFFLENSQYDFSNDSDFAKRDGVHYRKFMPSTGRERGKGYQEFEMLQNWLLAESDVPARFFKVTGRYRLENVKSIVSECLRQPHVGMRIDQFRRRRYAQSRIFCVDTKFFLSYLMNCYLDCDDRTGAWIERILFRWLLPHSSQCEFFLTEPAYEGVDGSTGHVIRQSRLRHIARTMLRRVNAQVDRTYLYV